jgi:hypothetical protein
MNYLLQLCFALTSFCYASSLLCASTAPHREIYSATLARHREIYSATLIIGRVHTKKDKFILGRVRRTHETTFLQAAFMRECGKTSYSIHINSDMRPTWYPNPELALVKANLAWDGIDDTAVMDFFTAESKKISCR